MPERRAGPFGTAARPAIRRLGPGLAQEATRLAAIHAEAFEEAERPWSAAEIEALAASPAVATLAAAEGFAMIRTAGGEAELLTIAVRPANRRAGLGAALLAACLQTARVEGATRLFLEVSEDNGPARALYAARGFAEVARRPRYYPRAGGPAADALVLARPLADRDASGYENARETDDAGPAAGAAEEPR